MENQNKLVSVTLSIEEWEEIQHCISCRISELTPGFEKEELRLENLSDKIEEQL